MVPANPKSSGLLDARQKLAFGPVTWVWGLLTGVALWLAGFILLPWWMALLIGWWPSIITGATISLATVAAAQLIAQRTRRAQDREPACPSRSAAVGKDRSIGRRKLRMKQQVSRRDPARAAPGVILGHPSSHATREMDQ